MHNLLKSKTEWQSDRKLNGLDQRGGRWQGFDMQTTACGGCCNDKSADGVDEYMCRPDGADQGGSDSGIILFVLRAGARV